MELYTFITTLENYLALSSKVEISNIYQRNNAALDSKNLFRERLDK